MRRSEYGRTWGDEMNECKHEKVRVTGDLVVLSDGTEIGISICKSCGAEVPETDEQ